MNLLAAVRWATLVTRILLLAAGLWAAGAAGQAPAISTRPATGSAAADWPPPALDRVIRERIDNGWHIGLVIGRMDADGTMRFAGYGVARRARRRPAGCPAGPAHDFELGSITKVFTGILLAEAQRRGEASLDTPLREFLPDGWSMPGPAPIPGDAGGGESDRPIEPIRLWHLATHTAGVPRMPSNLGTADPDDPFVAFDGDRLARWLRRFRPVTRPGTAFEYSNLGVGLLGYLLADRAGRTYESLVIERIAGPLGLDDVRVTLNQEQRRREAAPHVGRLPGHRWSFDALAGAGGLRGSAEDLLRFARANLFAARGDCGRIDTDDDVSDPIPGTLIGSMRLAQTPRFDASAGTRIGLGWVRAEVTAGPVWTHDGGTGGYRSFVAFQPDTGRCVVVLANSTVGVNDLGRWLLDPRTPLADLPPVPARSAEDLRPYTGTYRMAPFVTTTVTLHRTANGPVLAARVSGQAAMEILPVGPDRDVFAYSGVAAVLVFTRDGETGRASGVTLHQDGREIPMTRIIVESAASD